MRPVALLIQAAFVGLSAFAFWECVISSGGTGMAQQVQDICDRTLPPSMSHSWPQPHAPQGIRLDWFGTRGALPCKLVNIFQAAVHPHQGFATPTTPALRTFFLSFLSYLPTLVSLLTLSLSHRGLPSLAPVIGAGIQLFTAGVFLPTAVSPGLFSPPARSAARGKARKLGSLEVEGLIVAVAIGAVFPSYKLATVKDDQRWTIGWQFFPVYVWAIQKAYIFAGEVVFGRSNAKKGDARSALRALYTLLAASSLSAHFRILRYAFSSSTSVSAVLSSLFLPSLTPSPVPITQGIHRFLQYDYLVTHIALIALVTFRFQGRGIQRKLAFAYLLAGITFVGGPPLALLAGWWWVEERGWSEEA